MSSEPLRAVRDHLSEVVDRVEREHERVTITRNALIFSVHFGFSPTFQAAAQRTRLAFRMLLGNFKLRRDESRTSTLAHPCALPA